MARIRTIKPEFPQSESMGRVSRDARLLFVQLWTICDDEGRARGNSRMLASLLYPYDDDAKSLIDGWLDELQAEGCIDRYEVAGDKYLQIRKWLTHQKIDKPSKSKIPPFVERSREVEKVREDSRGVGDGSGSGSGSGSGVEVDQHTHTPRAHDDFDDQQDPFADGASARLPLDWKPNPNHLALYAKHAGVLIDEITDDAIREFSGYWNARGDPRTSAQWCQALVANVKNNRGKRNGTETGTTGRPRSLSAPERVAAAIAERDRTAGGRTFDQPAA